MPWIVYATEPPKGWSFPAGYFPLVTEDKKTALERAEEARVCGGRGVRVEKDKKKQYSLNR